MGRGTILLVEVNPHAAALLELFLGGRGFRLLAASSAAEALRLAAPVSGSPRADAVVLGHEPALLDAADVAVRLGAVFAPRRPLVVVMASGAVDPIQAANLGRADAVVHRPCHPRAVLDALRAAARRRDGDSAPYRIAPAAESALPS